MKKGLLLLPLLLSGCKTLPELPQPAPIEKVSDSIETMCSNAKLNEPYANKKYRGKSIELKGQFKVFDYVTSVKTDIKKLRVSVYFDVDDLGFYPSNGDDLDITGVVTRMSADSHYDYCSIYINNAKVDKTKSTIHKFD